MKVRSPDGREWTVRRRWAPKIARDAKRRAGEEVALLAHAVERGQVR